MASRPGAARLTRRLCTAGALLLCASLPGLPQTSMSLREAASRKPPEYGPAHDGQLVTVRGRVASPAFHMLPYTVMGLQDSTGGVALDVDSADTKLDSYRPG